MSNIIPPYINDRFNTLNAYIKNLYKAFVVFSANFSVDSSGNINLISPNDINIDASNNINITGTIVGSPLNLTSTEDINIDASNNINITGNIVGSPLNLTSTEDINIDVSNNINITGNIVGSPLNLTSTSDVNISGTSINIVSSASNEIYINDISGTQLFKIKYGNGPPTLFETGINNGSLYIDYLNGYMYIYRLSAWKVM